MNRSLEGKTKGLKHLALNNKFHNSISNYSASSSSSSLVAKLVVFAFLDI
jgi:hypothetical protein